MIENGEVARTVGAGRGLRFPCAALVVVALMVAEPFAQRSVAPSGTSSARGATSQPSARTTPSTRKPLAAAPMAPAGRVTRRVGTARAVRFEHDLGAIHELMGDGHWDRAHRELLGLLDEHEGADYVVRRAGAIELDLRRSAFWRDHGDTEHDALISGELLKFNKSMNRVKVRYTPATFDDFERHPAPDGWASLRVHPLDFSGPFKVSLEGHSDVHWERPVVLVGLAHDEAYVVTRTLEGTFGSSRSSKTWKRVDRLIHMRDGMTEILDERSHPVAHSSGSYRVEVEVSSTAVTARMSGGTVLRCKKRSERYGSVALGFPQSHRRDVEATFDEILLEGEGANGWIRGLLDAELRMRRAVFERSYVPPLPEWLAGEPSPATTGWEASSSTPSTSLSDSLRMAKVDRHWRRGEYDLGLTYLELLGVGRAGLPEPWRLLEMARFCIAMERPMEARRHCRALLRLDDEHVEARTLFARLYSSLGQPGRAVSELEALAADVPGHPAPWEALVDVALGEGQLDEAVDLLARARGADVRSEQLARWERRVTHGERGPDWPRTYVVESRHYRVKSDIDSRVCDKAAAVLEDAHRFICEDLALDVPEGEPFDVLLFSGDHGYTEYVQDAIGAVPHRTAGMYSHALRQLVIWNQPNEDEMLATVRHEGFHQLFHSVVRDVPRWLDEGLAEVYEHGKTVRGRWRLDGHVPAAHRDALRDGLVPLERFVFTDATTFMRDAASNYAQAWAFVTFLREGNADQQQRFTTLLERLVSNHTSISALRVAFSDVDWDEFDREFAADVEARLARR